MNETVASVATMPRIHGGMKIPLFREGEDGPQIIDASGMNPIVQACNSFLNGKARFSNRLALTISESGFVLEVPRAAVGGSTAAGGMFPFRVYNPTGKPANTFRVHGGVAILEQLFPAVTTPNTFQPESAGLFFQVNTSDQVYDTSSTSEGIDTYDIVLNNWLSGGGPAIFDRCLIWLELSQVLDSPGAITASLHSGFDLVKPVSVRTDHSDPFLETALIIPLAYVYPTSTDEDGDLLSSYVVQLWDTQILNVPIYPGRMDSVFDPAKMIWPNEVTFYGGDGNLYRNTSEFVVIGTNPPASPYLIRINQ